MFEDLGIAAFLIGIWGAMYDCSACIPLDFTAAVTSTSSNEELQGTGKPQAQGEDGRPKFPGWFDIGCGNGILAFILLSEGYVGTAFDARSRKTWSTFPPAIRSHITEMVLMPWVLAGDSPSSMLVLGSAPSGRSTDGDGNTMFEQPTMRLSHEGRFPKGTFVISNHADELTPWTPLLAYLSGCPFIAIPCCSHSLSGARWRAPTPGKKKAANDAESGVGGVEMEVNGNGKRKGNKSGTLARPAAGSGTSAYASLCAYVEKLADEVGFVVETEALRIPSTRNVAILGRVVRVGGTTSLDDDEGNGEVDGEADGGGEAGGDLTVVPIAQSAGMQGIEKREEMVKRIIKRELGRAVSEVGREWVERIGALVNSKGRNH